MNFWCICVLSAFFTWASTEFEFTNPMKGVPVPKFQKVPVDSTLR